MSTPNSSLYRPTRPEQPFLLAADVDGTLLGDEKGMGLLKALVDDFRPSFRLAYVTGRYLFSVRKLVEEGRLPQTYQSSEPGEDVEALTKNDVKKNVEKNIHDETELGD